MKCQMETTILVCTSLHIEVVGTLISIRVAALNCVVSTYVCVVALNYVVGAYLLWHLGTPVCTIIDEFLEKFQKGGRGGHFRSKKFRCKIFSI